MYTIKGPLAWKALSLFILISTSAHAGTTGFRGEEVTGSVSSGTKHQLDQALKNYRIFKLDAGAIYESVRSGSKARSAADMRGLTLQLGSSDYVLNLKPRYFTGKSTKIFVSTEQGIRVQADVPVETYQGYVNGNPEQIAAFSIGANDLEGVIQDSEGRIFYIEPMENIVPAESGSGAYVFYDVNDAIKEARNCGYADALSEKNNFEQTMEGLQVNAADVGFRVGLFCDNLYKNTRSGTVGRAISSMLKTLNMVEALFYAPAPPKGFSFHFNVTVIYVSAPNEITPDNNSSASTILDNFRSWGNAKTTPFKASDYDVASFWTPRVMSGSVPNIAGLAYGPNPPGACSQSKYNILRTNFQWSCPLAYAVDQAHEIGHNLACAHTSATSPLPTDVMQASIYQSANKWASASVSSINSFIASNTACIKALSAFIPEPDFTSNTNYGCGGSLTVTFTNKTDFGATSYLWDFGDGQTSTQANPVHTYSVSGKYTVKLTATNANGSATETKTDYVWVGGAANAMQTVPVSKTSGSGGYFGVGSNTAWAAMEFQALDDIQLISMKMEGNGAGTRLLYLTTDSGFTLIDTKEFNLPAQTLTKVDLNWRLEKGKKYIIYIHENGLINNTQYYNEHYRLSGASSSFYPKTVPGLISVTANHLMFESYYGRQNSPTGNTNWYIGFDWEVQKLCPVVSVGVKEQMPAGAFEVYPNPGHGLYTVRFEKDPAGPLSIDVFNVLGENVLSRTIDRYDRSAGEKIDLTPFAPGIYIVKVNSGNNQYVKSILNAE